MMAVTQVTHSTSNVGAGGGVGGGGGGPLSLISCVSVRETSPVEDSTVVEIKTESKKKRFHPLRNLRRMFRRKSRRTTVSSTTTNPGAIEQTEVCLEFRSNSTSRLLEDEQNTNRRRNSGLSPGLSLSHDSVFTPENHVPTDLENSSMSIPVLLPGVRAELVDVMRRRKRVTSREDNDDIDNLQKVTEKSAMPAKVMATRSSCSNDGTLPLTPDSCSASVHHHLSVEIDGGVGVDLLDVGVTTTHVLSHSAAKHKMAVRPKRRHGPPNNKRGANVSAGASLPDTPESTEETSAIVPQVTQVDTSCKQEVTLKRSSSSVSNKTNHRISVEMVRDVTDEAIEEDLDKKEESFFTRLLSRRRSGRKKKQPDEENEDEEQEKMLIDVEVEVVDGQHTQHFTKKSQVCKNNVVRSSGSHRTADRRQRVEPIDIPSSPVLLRHRDVNTSDMSNNRMKMSYSMSPPKPTWPPPKWESFPPLKYNDWDDVNDKNQLNDNYKSNWENGKLFRQDFSSPTRFLNKPYQIKKSQSFRREVNLQPAPFRNVCSLPVDKRNWFTESEPDDNKYTTRLNVDLFNKKMEKEMANEKITASVKKCSSLDSVKEPEYVNIPPVPMARTQRPVVEITSMKNVVDGYRWTNKEDELKMSSPDDKVKSCEDFKKNVITERPRVKRSYISEKSKPNEEVRRSSIGDKVKIVEEVKRSSVGDKVKMVEEAKRSSVGDKVKIVEETKRSSVGDKVKIVEETKRSSVGDKVKIVEETKRSSVGDKVKIVEETKRSSVGDKVKIVEEAKRSSVGDKVKIVEETKRSSVGDKVKIVEEAKRSSVGDKVKIVEETKRSSVGDKVRIVEETKRSSVGDKMKIVDEVKRISVCDKAKVVEDVSPRSSVGEKVKISEDVEKKICVEQTEETVPEFMRVQLNKVECRNSNLILTMSEKNDLSDDETTVKSVSIVSVKIKTPSPVKLIERRKSELMINDTCEVENKPTYKKQVSCVDVTTTPRVDDVKKRFSLQEENKTTKVSGQKCEEVKEEVTMRRKSLTSKEQSEDEPELMKVFARRSLKIKDDQPEILTKDEGIENDEVEQEELEIEEEMDDEVNRTRDSDKENESSPKEERKRREEIKKPVKCNIEVKTENEIKVNVTPLKPAINTRNTVVSRFARSLSDNGIIITNKNIENIKITERNKVISEEEETWNNKEKIKIDFENVNEDDKSGFVRIQQRKAEWEKRLQQAAK